MKKKKVYVSSIRDLPVICMGKYKGQLAYVLKSDTDYAYWLYNTWDEKRNKKLFDYIRKYIFRIDEKEYAESVSTYYNPIPKPTTHIAHV